MPESHKQIIRLTKTILSLIDSRNSQSSNSCAKEALHLTLCIIELDKRRNANREMIGILNQEPDPHTQLSKLKTTIDNALQEAYNLGAMSSLYVAMTDIDNGQEILAPEERVTARLTEASDILSMATEIAKPRKGRTKQFDKHGYIEAIIQIFERARGITFDELAKMSEQERRKTKTSFYQLLDASSLDPNFTQSPEAFRKAADRYIKDGREQYDDVRDTLNEILRS